MRPGATVHWAAVPHGRLPCGEVDPDPLADPLRVDTFADRVDRPGAVLVGDLERTVDGRRWSGTSSRSG